LISRVLRILATGAVAALWMSSVASAATTSFSADVVRTGGATVLKIHDAGQLARAVVQWGDGHSTVARRACGSSSRTPLLAPRVFERSATYHVAVRASRACDGRHASPQTLRLVVHAKAPGHVSASAAAAAADVSSSDQWTTFSQPDALSASRLTYVQGSVTADDGCRIPGGSLTSDDVAPGATTVEVREDAIDPSTCTYLYETGTPPVGDSVAPSGGQSGSSSATASPNPSTDTSAHAAAVASHTVHLYTAFRDPIDITVNSMRQVEHWTDSNGCVLSSSGTANWTWYTTSGWFDFGGTEGNDTTCAHGIDRVYHAMGNNKFCALQEVTSFYNTNALAGHGNGSWAANWNDYNTGAACKDLLHFVEEAGAGG
jgi:hypothetical protein